MKDDIQIPVQSTDEARTLLGPLDSNVRLIREMHGVSVLVRDGSLRLLGEPEQVQLVQNVLEDSLYKLRAGQKVSTQSVADRLRGGLDEAPADAAANAADAKAQGARSVQAAVKARTKGQQVYLDAMEQHDVVFGIGPAGTGKTYLAVAQAIESMRRGQVRRIVLVRPAVEAGEKLGFLPGDFQQKVDPYLRPMYDALQDLLDVRTRTRWLESDVVEICPLAFMRGRTLNRSFVILDEAQNASVPQMLMFLTRLGEGSRMVITGDPSQVDLPRNVTSGLADAVRRLSDVEEIGFVQLGAEDVVRHGVVRRIIGAYEDPSA
ncbi:MAG: PhoH family protein [Planctomycetota bacterium]|nr:PhoH family protein [Planctomycetota bacterium]